MKSTVHLTRLFVFAVMLLTMASNGFAEGEPVCPDGTLRFMTINLLFSERAMRDERLARIADYIDEHCSVDVILVQEVVSGALAGTLNSALDLKNILAAKGHHYYLSYRLANGLPGLLGVGNAILSRHRILFTVAKTLPFVTEEPFEGFEIPLRRIVMMSRIRVPGVGKINVYNTHLCAFCDPGERLAQAQVLFQFMTNVERFIPGTSPIVLGGDFNTEDTSALYGAIAGVFTDSYSAANCGSGPCTDGATFAVPGNPFDSDEPSVRIDYIFLKHWEDWTISSDVVFDSEGNGDWVSDHSAVVTGITYPH
jgi:maltose 6'-phosphate phosphatase